MIEAGRAGVADRARRRWSWVLVVLVVCVAVGVVWSGCGWFAWSGWAVGAGLWRVMVGWVWWMLGFRWWVGRCLRQRAVVVGWGSGGVVGGFGCCGCWWVGCAGVVRGVADCWAGGGVVFLFPGQGSQWRGMAVGLLDSSPVFAGCWGSVGRRWRRLWIGRLEDVLRGVGGAPGLDRVDVVQPVLWAVMVSLAGLWDACGVRPVGVVGHSQGEIAAARVAGGLSLEDAARVVALRSRALLGWWWRVGWCRLRRVLEKLGGWLERWAGRVGVAAVNGPASVVVSGERGALDGVVGGVCGWWGAGAGDPGGLCVSFGADRGDS